jgi:hypothetical protein
MPINFPLLKLLEHVIIGVKLIIQNSIASDEFNQFINEKYYRNLSNTLSDNHQNNFSVKVIYFLDYLSLKKKNKTT